MAEAGHGAERLARGCALVENRLAADGIPAEKSQADAPIARGHDVLVHAACPVFVVPDRKENLAPLKHGGIAVHVEVGTIRDVVAPLFHPKRQRKLPQQVLARTEGQRDLVHLAVLRVGPVEAAPHVGSPVVVAVGGVREAVVVQRVAARPLVVGVPGKIAHLEQEIRRPLVLDYEDHVALDRIVDQGQLPEVNTAGPGGGNGEPGAWLPGALAHPLHAHHGHRLRFAGEGTQTEHVASARAGIIAGPVDVDGELGRGVGADEKIECLARVRAGIRDEALQSRGAEIRLVEAVVLQLPLHRSRTPVFLEGRAFHRSAGGGQEGRRNRRLKQPASGDLRHSCLPIWVSDHFITKIPKVTAFRGRGRLPERRSCRSCH